MTPVLSHLVMRKFMMMTVHDWNRGVSRMKYKRIVLIPRDRKSVV